MCHPMCAPWQHCLRAHVTAGAVLLELRLMGLGQGPAEIGGPRLTLRDLSLQLLLLLGDGAS